MRLKRVDVIQCGAQTCASEPGEFCKYVRAGSFGTKFFCVYFEKRLEERDGWLMRTDMCLREFKEEVANAEEKDLV